MDDNSLEALVRRALPLGEIQIGLGTRVELWS